jgi:two-component system chemotaxis response regulator CheB
MTSRDRIRVVVVDDSAFARKVMREVLTGDPRIEVVAVARDGLDALEKVMALKPDVVTLDLVMPNLDGIGVLDALRDMPAAPRVIVVTMSDADSPLGVAALQAGAFDVVHKPTAIATDRLYELGAELVAKVVFAASAPPGPNLSAGNAPPPSSGTLGFERTGRTKLVVVGASTGGPRAITVLLRALPKEFPVPLCIVVHMPPGYTETFASRLDRECELDVVEAREGLELRPGLAVIARAGIHMKLRATSTGWATTLDVLPLDSLHRPSVDALFESAAQLVGAGALGVVMTGMGSDGLEGARALKAVGGRTIVEDASTCVVYGMPRAIAVEGLAEAEVPLPDLAAAIASRL